MSSGEGKRARVEVEEATKVAKKEKGETREVNFVAIPCQSHLPSGGSGRLFGFFRRGREQWPNQCTNIYSFGR